ncbi:transposase [Leptolyngbya sp. PCC 7375]|nr:transposase [Leptolyngbya sp. PCC 7375]
MPETDAIFENVTTANQAADADPTVLRLSIDSKATVKLGNLSRGGKARTQAPRQADDHDHYWHSCLVPFGILDTQNDQLFIYFGQSAETSDFIVDCLEEWWLTHADEYREIEQLVINLDNGPSLNSHRTQFIKRIVGFAQASRLCIRLIYYPPYHSKYNPIERCWAALENYWNGTILNTIEEALRWATNMTWRGCTPVVDLVDKVYHKGVKASSEELAKLEPQWQRSEQLPKWDVTVVPL